MKRTVAILTVCVLVVCLLLSCHYEGTYDEGYSEGYDDGYSDGKFDMQSDVEDGILDGYDTGYHDGYCEGRDYGWIDNAEEIGRYFEEEAVDYALDHSEWHPEEAWMIIEAYQNNEPLHEGGSTPSRQDYLDAIDSLIYFYDYFYSARYE